MKNKKILISLLSLIFIVVPILSFAAEATSTDVSDKNEVFIQKTEKRKNGVENAVKTMMDIAGKIGANGEKLKTLTEEQKTLQDSIEADLQTIIQRKGFVRFLIGPNYATINSADEKIVQLDTKIEGIKEVRRTILNKELSDLTHTQIHVFVDSMDDLEDEVRSNRGGFSLFGWVNYLLNKYF